MDPARVQWIEQVGAEWFQNPARAVLLARLDPEFIDVETMKYVGAAARAATQAYIADEQRCARGASVGFFSQPDRALAARAQQLKAFLDMMTLLAQHVGDPPAPDALRAVALEILQGTRSPADGVVLAADDPAAATAQVEEFVRTSALNGTDAAAWLTRVGLYNAAMALPRERLLELGGRAKPAATAPAKAKAAPADPVETARQTVASIIAKTDALGDDAAAKKEAMLLEALDAADVTPETDDDVDTLMRLLLLVEKHQLGADTVRKCVARLVKLVDGGLVGDYASTLTTTLAGIVAAGDMSQELDEPLATAGGKVLAGELQQDNRIRLTAAVARGWLRVGRPDNADRALRALRKRGIAPAEALDIACVEADVRTAGGDNADAADVLVDALDATKSLSFEQRKMALQALVCLWPPERGGGDAWVGEYEAGVESMDEPFKTLSWMTLVLAIQKTGDAPRALAYGRRVDFAALRKQLPKDFAAMTDQMEAGFASTMSELEKAAQQA
jgi:hypothetical protein